ncbi:hypothetical protein CFP56_004463 [Quercus suber]|uniref:DUF4283 domain-containing protein n=1 Tax=Quercus suber TaxID=58331 RepID=A0AAW0LCX1_QUESU
MEDLSRRCEKLKLSEHEGDEVDIDVQEATEGWILAGKFLTKRRINIEAVVKALKPIWKTSENFEVQDASDNTVLFLFQNEEDMERVLWSSPWSFDKYLVVLQKFETGDSVSTMSFYRAPFWVQIHGGRNGGGKSSGRTREQPQTSSKPGPTTAARSHGGETVTQGTNPHRVVDLEMEDTSPQKSRAALFSEQLREIDQAIKEFDILKEENKGKDNHVVYNRRVPASHGGPQMKQNLNVGSKQKMEAHTVLEKRGGVTNKVDGPIDSPILQKENLSPRESIVKHKEARVLAQTFTYGSFNTFIPEGVGHTSDYQLSHNNSLGKENKTGNSTVDKTNGDRGTEKLGTWKRIPREPVEGKDRANGEKAVDSPSTSRRKRGPKPFRFETMWLKEKSCADVVSTA